MASTSTASNINIFDRSVKRKQRDWAARQPDFELYEYVKSELAWRTVDRMYDCTDTFDVAIDLGCGAGWMAPHVFKVIINVYDNKQFYSGQSWCTDSNRHEQ
jgi:NADH dehydrogenase [ubiquinone] 1 alpha subcomplex assembly factor 5